MSDRRKHNLFRMTVSAAIYDTSAGEDATLQIDIAVRLSYE